MSGHVKRSGWDASQQLDWVGFTDVHASAQGVGARQAQVHAPRGGGGYLDECTLPKDWEEARLRELAEMGLPAIWIDVAKAIGYEPFLTLWRLLDAEYSRRTRQESHSMIVLELRRYRSFQRYQRNRFIEAMAPLLTDQEIQQRVADELGEDLSIRHIVRILDRRRMAP